MEAAEDAALWIRVAMEIANKLPDSVKKRQIANSLKLQLMGLFHRNLLTFASAKQPDSTVAQTIPHNPHRASLAVLELQRIENQRPKPQAEEAAAAAGSSGITMSGFLAKRKTWRRKWRTSWFEIADGQLRQKKRSTSVQIKRTILLSDCTWMEYNSVVNKPFCFTLLRRGHDPLILCCRDSSCFEQWRAAIVVCFIHSFIHSLFHSSLIHSLIG